MAYQGISTGSGPNQGDGDTLVAGAIKINSNFSEIYTALGDGTNISLTKNRSIIAGAGLTGGGNLNADRTISVRVGSGITISDGSVGVDTSVIRSSGNQTITGNLTATSFVKSGGTSSQFLKADGSVDTNAYITVASVPGAANNGQLSLQVSGTGLSGSQTFTANQSTDATFTVTSNATPSSTPSTLVSRDGAGNFSAGIITATSFVKSGGTSSQFLKADGSIDTNVYAIVADVPGQANNGQLSLQVSGTGLSGSQTFTANQSTNATFIVTSNATPSGTTSGTLVSRGSNGDFSAGSITATSFVRSGGTSSQFLKANGSVDSNTYAIAGGTSSQFLKANGSYDSNTYAIAGGTSSQFLKADGSYDSNTYATVASVPAAANNGQLTLQVSGTGLSGSQTFTANQSTNATFTVTSNATPSSTPSTLVSRDGAGNFSAGIITATTFSGTLLGNASNATNASNINISAITSSDTSTSVVLVGNQATGNQSPFIDSELTYDANGNKLFATTFVGNLQGIATTATTATNATNIGISTTTSSDTFTSVVLVANQTTGNQSPFIDSGLTYDANGNSLFATNFVGNGTIPVGGIIMWSGSIASIPTGWALCNGSNGTPDLRDRFIVGAGSGYNPGDTGGANSVTLDLTQIPSHSHPGTAAAGGRHGHKIRMSDYSGSFGVNVVGGGRGGIITFDDDDSNVGGRIADPTSNKFAQLGGADGGDVDANGQHTHSVSTEARGGGQAHENRPPYYALAFIMRAF